MQELAKDVRNWLDQGQRTAVGRVVDVQGFSTWDGDPLIALNEAGDQSGELLGRIGAARLRDGARSLWAADRVTGLASVTIEIDEDAAVEAGLACGGQVDVLLQAVSEVPIELWTAFASRSPVALVTRTSGPAAGSAALVVHADGTWSGALGAGDAGGLAASAADLLRQGHTVSRRVEDADGGVLIEVWVPQPRVVVAGTGELAKAIAAQAGLLGWDTEVGEDPADVDRLLAWAGASACLVVLSHDPRLDGPALAAGLRSGAAYVGALGSRRTQSRRMERLIESGFDPAELERIRRPIGLDLGGRSPAEVALAICAEILAVHCGRDGRPLVEHTGPINNRPAVISE